jgi:hypothetical protein
MVLFIRSEQLPRRNRNRMKSIPSFVLWAWERPEDLRFINPHDMGVAFLADSSLLVHSPYQIRTPGSVEMREYRPLHLFFTLSFSENPRKSQLQVSRIASRGNTLPWTIRDAIRIGSVTAPNSDAAACGPERTGQRLTGAGPKIARKSIKRRASIFR